MRYLLILLLLAGCEDRFRYPCQDNKNWNKPECQRNEIPADSAAAGWVRRQIQIPVPGQQELEQA